MKLSKDILSTFQNSFVIPIDVIPGRMALLTTLLLCLTNMLDHSNLIAPKTSTNSLNILSTWMIICYITVGIATLEYGLILALKFYFDSTKVPSSFYRKIDVFAYVATHIFFSLFVFSFWCYRFWRFVLFQIIQFVDIFLFNFILTWTGAVIFWCNIAEAVIPKFSGKWMFVGVSWSFSTLNGSLEDPQFAHSKLAWNKTKCNTYY